MWSYPAINLVLVSDFKFPGRHPSFGRIDNGEEEQEELYNPRGEEARTYWDINRSGLPKNPLFVWTPFVDPDAPGSSHGPSKSIKDRSSRSTEPMLLDSLPSTAVSYYEDDQQFRITDDPVVNIWNEIRPPPKKTTAPTRPYRDYVNEMVSFETRRDIGVYAGLFDADCTYSIEREQEAAVINDGEPMTDTRKLEHVAEMKSLFHDLETQRDIMHRQMERRIFKRARGDATISRQPVAWHLPKGSAKDICYPVRVSGIHGDVSLHDFLSMLCEVLEIFPTDIVLMSDYSELDGTISIELGLRYCEDTLALVTMLNGVKSDDRYIEVQFLHAMVGGVSVFPYPLDPKTLPRGYRTLLTRLKRVVALTRYPCSPSEVTNTAFLLESQLARKILEGRLATMEEVQGIRRHSRRTPGNGKFSI
jgi:hypothetical protein